MTDNLNRFTQKTNPMTGKIEWVELSEDPQDYDQEIAISHYGDMLHDIDRNEKYRLAIEKTVQHMIKNLNYQKIKVLDLGTGTGLLSMFACKVDPEKVKSRGIEVFKPIAEVAKKCIKLNGLENNIEVINCRSDDLPADVKDDEKRSNLLITELFDTELIGEGCLESYSHALKNNCTTKPFAVPHSAKIYAQLVDSKFITQCHQLINHKKYDNHENFNGGPFYDFQMSELVEDRDFTVVTKPIEVYDLQFTDFNSTNSLVEKLSIEVYREYQLQKEKQEKDLNFPVIFTWWDLFMDFEGEFKITLAPNYIQKRPTDQIPWRDHWLQAAYFINQIEDLKFFNHDEYSCWFGDRENNQTRALWNRERFFSNNYLVENNLIKYCNKIKTILPASNIGEKNTVIIFGDSTVLGIELAARFKESRPDLNFLQIYTTQSLIERDFYSYYVRKFDISSNFSQLSYDAYTIKPSLLRITHPNIPLIISEPYFSSSNHCWHDLLFLNFLPDIPHFPSNFSIKSCLIKFENLHKIRYPVGIKSNLNLQPIDEIVQNSLDKDVNSKFENFSLWEYPGKIVSEVVEIFDEKTWKTDCFDKKIKEIDVKWTRSDNLTTFHAVLIWMRWSTDQSEPEDSKFSINLGPTDIIENGLTRKWFPGRKQSIKFLAQRNCSIKNPENDFKMEFNLEKMMIDGSLGVEVKM